jgi:hypothetical protein
MEPSFNAPKSLVILALQTVLGIRVPETPSVALTRRAGFSFVMRPKGRSGTAPTAGAVLINRPPVSAFGQTGHLSGHRRRAEFDPHQSSVGLTGCSAHPLTDPRQFGILQSGPGWRGIECNSIN